MRTPMLAFALALVFAPQLGRTDTPPSKPTPSPTSKAPPAEPAPAEPVQKPAKQVTRAELETEVEQLRVENRKLRAELAAIQARDDERVRVLNEEKQKITGARK